jgi:DNA polymerase III subunit alpha
MTNLDFENVDLLCPKTWDLIADGNTKGVFQLESRLGQSMAKKLKPETIEHLSALISILRPGCLEAIRDGKTVSNHYIDKKNGLESIDYFHESLESILGSTYGEMVYQEQAMQICQKIAAFNLSEADMVRKAIGKKKPEEMAKIKTLFIEKTKDTGIINANEAEQIFSWIEKSQRYSFNKSHAISYALNAYVSAYAKAHHPHEFFTAYLRFAKDKIDPMKEVSELVNNATENGISIYKPDLRKLNKDFVLDNNIIYFGLTNIKGIGESVFNKLFSIIDTNKIDLNNINVNELLFLILDKINSTAAKALVCTGCVDYIKTARKKILFYLDIIQNLSTREKELIINGAELNGPLDEILLFILDKVNKKRYQAIVSLINAIKNPAYSLEDNYEWIASTEKQHLGVSITCSIVDGRDLEAANTDCRSLNKQSSFSKSIIVGAEIDDVNIVKTKRGANPGQEMAFIKIADGTGSCDVVAFPKEFETYRGLLYKDNTIMFSLEQSKKKDGFFVKKCWQI